MSATQVAAHLTPLELFEQADIIVKSILMLLTFASLVSLVVIVDKLLRFARLRRNATACTAAFIVEPVARPSSTRMTALPVGSMGGRPSR